MGDPSNSSTTDYTIWGGGFHVVDKKPLSEVI